MKVEELRRNIIALAQIIEAKQEIQRINYKISFSYNISTEDSFDIRDLTVFVPDELTEYEKKLRKKIYNDVLDLKAKEFKELVSSLSSFKSKIKGFLKGDYPTGKTLQKITKELWAYYKEIKSQFI